ncbi:MAG: DNA damage-inducible protein 1 [Watsoniomyces obsoletus]|nr:MAG: DNA damage-inducible protein 1 [Watsoniomyces obsoletus]
MFAVPGWALSPTDLKRQKTGKNVEVDSTPDKKLNETEKLSKDSKKRKRREGQVTVNEKNVAELWEKFIDGRGDGGQPSSAAREEPRKRAKKVKRDKGDSSQEEGNGKPSAVVNHSSKDDDDSHVEAEPERQVKDVKKNKQQSKMKTKKTKERSEKKKNQDIELASPSQQGMNSSKNHPKNEPESTKPVVATTSQVQLTPLQASMREKLISARFRHLNQNLYTTSSTDSFQHFQNHPDMFDEYHQGFRRQVASWPENPVDSFILDIEHRGKIKPERFSTKRPRESKSQEMTILPPLPRTNGTCTIVDLGCGEAIIAQSFNRENKSKKLKLQIHSYDFQQPNQFVTVADIANLPLRDQSVDVAIFCLALMGTNWIEFIEEAYRVLRWKGELWIAEIKSRFVSKRKSVASRPSLQGNPHGRDDKKLLSTKKQKGKNMKKNQLHKGEEDDEDDEVLADGDAGVGYRGRDAKTDISAFVEVLRRRGFALSTPPNDTSNDDNKMFVKMMFIKTLIPSIGKNKEAAAAARERERERERGRGVGGGKSKPKFLDDDDEKRGGVTLEEETRVLKPCVYKTR